MATQTYSFSVFSMSLIIFFLILITNAKSETFSFNFPNFKSNVNRLGFSSDAYASSKGVLKLTKTDQSGHPLQTSVGLAWYNVPIRIYNKTKGKVGNFTTQFSFVVNPKGHQPHGDGMTFFIASPDVDVATHESSGGYLGLFNPKTAFDASKNKLVAVEFDSFANQWDPKPLTQSPHIGIDVGSLKSAATVEWPSEAQPEGAIATASIGYDFETQKLIVWVNYPKSGGPLNGSAFDATVDIATVLPENVVIGFSAATGALVETHGILSWSFISNF